MTMKQLNALRWHEVSTNPDYIGILADYNELRKNFVDLLLKISINKSDCQDCFASAVGSVDLTSDYDITVNNFGTSSLVAEIFNDTFEKLWDNVTSAEIFDTNIYAVGYFTKIKPRKKLPKPFRMFSYKGDEFGFLKCVIGRNNCKLDRKNQREWAILQLVKQHKMLKKKLNADIINTKITIPDFDNYVNVYDKKMGNINQFSQSSMNKEYVNKIKEIEKYYKVMVKSNKSIDLLKYKNLIANAMFFGNETYFTQGAFFHVVGIIQMQSAKMITNITNDELMDSVIENFAYLYLEFVAAKNIWYFISLSSKYLVRIFDGIDRINGTNEYYELIERLKVAKKFRRKKIHKFGDKILMGYILNLIGQINFNKQTLLSVMMSIVKTIKQRLPEFPIFIIDSRKRRSSVFENVGDDSRLQRLSLKDIRSIQEENKKTNLLPSKKTKKTNKIFTLKDIKEDTCKKTKKTNKIFPLKDIDTCKKTKKRYSLSNKIFPLSKDVNFFSKFQ